MTQLTESETVLVPYEEAYGDGFEDTRRRVPDTSKITAAVGWQPSASLDQILEEVIDHMRAVTSQLTPDQVQSPSP